MFKKLALVFLTVGMMFAISITAFAEGWTQEGENWVYLDANNTRVKNEWRKGADDKWRYLNAQGNMSRSCIVDLVYYVDSEGIMAESVWKQITDGTGTFWYYFDKDGKMVSGKWMEINGKKYCFDDDGRMQTGWLDDDMYYCDPADGHMITGWKNLNDFENKDSDAPSGKDGQSSHWYYFQDNGRKVVPAEGDFLEKRIDDKRYCFDVNGAMATGWVNITGGEDISGYKYFNKDGTVRTGWYSLMPPEGMEDNYANQVEWFYFSSTGAVTHDADGIYTISDIKRINTRRYLFNRYGTPVYGLIKLYTNTAKTDYETYYFGTFTQSSVQSGKINLVEGDGTKSVFCFNNSGQGHTGVKGSNLYYKGKMQKAEVGARYEAIRVGGVNYLVNQSGTVMKNKKNIKDTDDNIWCTNSMGVVTSENGSSNIHYVQPTEVEFPDYDY